ncbi:MAG: hypothetical protein M3P93_06790 [Actinomycetota bacterium]|nr:hypothetical protein [Actinomycetota bacterium]
MGESDMSTPSGQDREGAAAAMRDLPGETALGHVDPATVEGVEGQTPIAQAAADAGFNPDVGTARDGDPSAASSGAEGGTLPLSDMDRSGTDTPLGDLSTGGDAARQALGVDPRETSGGEIPDRSTGEATRDEVTGSGG